MFLVDNMTCPNCGASNKTKKFKPLKKTRSRWQPKRRSIDMDEYDTPSIVLHDDCRSRLCGSISTRVSVICDGCPSAFNCLTGNVDDGFTSDNLVEKIKEEKSAQIEKAKIQAEDTKKRDEYNKFLKLVDSLKKLGFSYSITDGQNYARFGGTVWKLAEEDKKAILDNSWHTPKTMVMKNTFVKHDISLELVRELFSHVLPS
jgi:hypothetical protein